MKNNRLNLYLSQSGLCSRRKADELIKSGEITVNHWVTTDPAYLVQEKDTVRHNKEIVKPESLSYLILNKPEGYVTSLDDQFNRPTVIDLIGKEVKCRVYPVGRLDYNTTGILFMTNDGDLAQKLAHPTFNTKKIYMVTLKTELTDEDLNRIRHGLFLKDGPAKVDSIIQERDKKTLRVGIHSGRNRIIRRIFESLGYTVKKLDRIFFAGMTKKGLAVGDWRFLSPGEIKKLKQFEATAKPTPKPRAAAKKSVVKTIVPKRVLAKKPAAKRVVKPRS